MLTDKRIYLLPAEQIVLFWEAIKFACKQADEVNKEDYGRYFNELLQASLSKKAQCFVVLDQAKVLHNIAITRLTTDKVLQRKELFLQCLYSMSIMSEIQLREYFNFIAEFAKQEKCSTIVFNSRNYRVWELAKLVGISERYRSFEYRIGG